MLIIDGKSVLVLEYPVEFVDGKMTGFNRKEFDNETKYLNGSYVVRVQKPRKRRSTKQNNVQWWYFNEIAKETGHTPNMIKGICQAKFLLRETADKETGEVMPYILDTSELSTTEHNIFMEEVRDWAREMFNITLQLPGEKEINHE